MLYRNCPRDFRYQYLHDPAAARRQLLHLPGQRPGRARAAARPAAASSPRRTRARHTTAIPEGEPRLARSTTRSTRRGGFDVKWTPNAGTVIDATVNPDFSQIESDTAQISANERFALFFPEKRPFFLEGIELLLTPIQAVYTRTMTDPRWGARATGRAGGRPTPGWSSRTKAGAASSSRARTRPNWSTRTSAPGPASAGSVTSSENRLPACWRQAARFEDGGHNRVAGPDFDWRLGSGDSVTGQLLLSWTRTPERPELSEKWDGGALQGHAGRVQWRHSRRVSTGPR